MADFHFTIDDAEVIVRAIERLRDNHLSEHLDKRLEALELKILHAVPYITAGEFRNICIGLEQLLEDNALDWKAATLLKRLRALLSTVDDRNSPESHGHPR